MMRPMKLAGKELMFGAGCLEHLKTLKGSKAFIVTGGTSMKKSGILQKVIDYLKEANIDSTVFSGVEPDPLFSTVEKGANAMKEYKPDIIIGLGGGSAMDAAKAMWIYYENEELKTLHDILPPNEFPKLRNKAYLVCIPSTSGTASEVSRSIVITEDETHKKYGIGNMEMMPDIAICDPAVTVSMPDKITAETGMDALAHALEAWVSNRANHVSDILAEAAVKDIVEYLPRVFEDRNSLEYREKMLNASLVAGMAFTNVSLGIVHSMAHTLGSLYGLAHGLLNAVLLPFVMEFNSQNIEAKDKYERLAANLNKNMDLISTVKELNSKVNNPSTLSDLIPDEKSYLENMDTMIDMALADGCTKTNPIIPTREELRDLYLYSYYGRR
ncbi:iron-containing alcohol dehydrogenase [Proteiniborus sp. MB09-C3]|uniref:iron-containing alcohol dehydrogenase n=1 Tax=Proteiniborus sp. MB09-C3 TaxID=3050072 RepID=UPI0025534E54|nr:iron-containing alcohol dehydrogenase [Proteiniborus sp. MB09-C3]WIV11619.1 iron-containing alcohol dehydrogenase [Proteiniborus sp. MB09-C3]